MIWTTIFDVHDNPWRYLPVLMFGLLLLFFAIKAVRDEAPKGRKDSPPIGTKILHRYAIAFAMLWIGLVGFSAWTSTVSAIWALNSASYQRVEGPVTRLYQTGWKGKVSDLFSIGSIRFSYYDYDARSTDDNRVTDPGCIVEGVPVRIAYKGNRVLKLEIGSRYGQPRPNCHRDALEFLPGNEPTIYRDE